MMNRRHAHVPAAAGCVLLFLVLTGCSAQSAAYGQLSQTAKNASSAAHSITLVLSLHQSGKVVEPVVDTGIEDALTKLDQTDTTLTSMSTTGQPVRWRAKILAAVRRTQDAALAAQVALSSGNQKTIPAAIRALEHDGRVLDSLNSEMEKKQ